MYLQDVKGQQSSKVHLNYGYLYKYFYVMDSQGKMSNYISYMYILVEKYVLLFFRLHFQFLWCGDGEEEEEGYFG